MKPKDRGVNILLSIDTYNSLFGAYFSSNIIECTKYSTTPTNEQIIYYYGLRKLCGLTYLQMSILLGFNSSFECSHTINRASKKLCIYDAEYSPEFVLQWANFRKYCRNFRTPLTNAERSRRFRAKQRNKKTRKK
jgi:hypothetical protein